MVLEDGIGLKKIEQIRLFSPDKLLQKLTDLHGDKRFHFDFMRGTTTPGEAYETKFLKPDSAAFYILLHGEGDKAERLGSASFETGRLKQNNHYFESLILVTEDQIKLANKSYLPRATIKILLSQEDNSKGLDVIRYDRQRGAFSIGWSQTPKIKSLLPTTEFIADQYLNSFKEKFNPPRAQNPFHEIHETD